MNGYSYGGFWRRVMATVIDQVILGLLYAILFVIGSLSGLPASKIYGGPATGAAWGLLILYQSFCVVVHAAYYTYFHGVTGRTPGKAALGLKVIQVSGDELTLGVAFLRWVGYWVSSLCLSLGYLWVAFDPRKQGWHDKIAGTLVVRGEQKDLDKGVEI